MAMQSSGECKDCPSAGKAAGFIHVDLPQGTRVELTLPFSTAALYQFLVQDSPKAGLDLAVVNARETIRLAR